MNRLKFIDRMAQGKVTRRQMMAGAGAFGVGMTVMSRMAKADPLVCLEWAGYDTPDHFGSYVAKHGAPPSFSIFANETGSGAEGPRRIQCRHHASLHLFGGALHRGEADQADRHRQAQQLARHHSRRCRPRTAW